MLATPRRARGGLVTANLRREAAALAPGQPAGKTVPDAVEAEGVLELEGEPLPVVGKPGGVGDIGWDEEGLFGWHQPAAPPIYQVGTYVDAKDFDASAYHGPRLRSIIKRRNAELAVYPVHGGPPGADGAAVRRATSIGGPPDVRTTPGYSLTPIERVEVLPGVGPARLHDVEEGAFSRVQGGQGEDLTLTKGVLILEEARLVETRREEPLRE
jgi:hypothetical protein